MRQHTQQRSRPFLPALVCITLFSSLGFAADQPQWGQAWTRNMVSEETGLVKDFDPETGRNVKWVVPLGSETWATPVVAQGRVFLGTNNDPPR
ncbi:MAG: PQQ-binding-like beta-propeller repeat protein, partial [Solirubrobacterales bacterium]